MLVFGARGGRARYTRTASTTPGDRRRREDHAPTGCISDQPAQGARNEDPGQDSRDDDADDAATACEISEITCERSENLPRHGGHSYDRDREQEEAHGRRNRAQCERGRSADHHRRNEMPTVANITQRDNQHDPRGVADLSRGDKPTGRRSRRSEVARDEAEERLCQVEISDCDATRHGKQQRQRASHQPLGLIGCGRSPSVEPDVLPCSLAPAGLDLHRPAILYIRENRTCSGDIPEFRVMLV